MNCPKSQTFDLYYLQDLHKVIQQKMLKLEIKLRTSAHKSTKHFSKFRPYKVAQELTKIVQSAYSNPKLNEFGTNLLQNAASCAYYLMPCQY